MSRKIRANPNATDFGKILYACLVRKGLSVNEFAKRIGLTPSFISSVYGGRKPPPIDRLTEWADRLNLKGAERAAFVLIGHLEHSSPLVKRWFHQQRELLLQAIEQGYEVGGFDHRALEIAGDSKNFCASA